MVMENLHANALQDGQVDEWFFDLFLFMFFEWIAAKFSMFISIKVKHVRNG